MIPIKNSEGIRRMRESCAIAATVLARLKEQVRPGITTKDLDEIGRDLIASLGARSACHGYQLHSRRYPAYTCLSVNEEVVHGIGSLKRILRDGGAQRVEELARWDLDEDRDDRDDEEPEAERRRRPEQHRERAAHSGSPKPAVRSAIRPLLPSSAIRNDCAASRSAGFAAIAAW